MPPSSGNMNRSSADMAQRHLTRRSLVGVCVMMTLGSCYGLFVAGPAGLLTPFEWYSIPPVLLTGLAMLALIGLRGDDWIAPFAPVLTLWLALYVIGNIGNALYFAPTHDNVTVHLAWLVPLYLFSFVVNRHRAALWLTGGMAALAAALLLGRVVSLAGSDITFAGAMVSWTVAQIAALLLIGGVASFRERFAAETAAAAALSEANSRISALAERLGESEARSRRLIEFAPDVPVLVDAEGRVDDVTPNCCRLWGLERDALLGRPFASLFAAEQQEAVAARLDQAQREAAEADHKPPTLQPGAIRHANGQDYPVRWSAAWSAPEARYYIWVQAA